MQAEQPPLVIPLWEGNPPDMVAGAGPGIEQIGEDGVSRTSNVGIPGLFVHLPPTTDKNRPAVILCPGGAYKRLAAIPTGNDTLAPFLADNVAVIVLKYRTSPPSTQVEADALADARRAVRLVRSRAAEWGIDPHQIGMVGWSAGANLVLNLVSHPDQPDTAAADPIQHQSSRPDFVAMLCPWPNKQPISAFPISKGAPPAFIASARDDTTAPTAFAEAIAQGYRAAGAPCEIWIIDAGGHRAFSAGSKGEGSHWRSRFMTWLGRASS